MLSSPSAVSLLSLLCVSELLENPNACTQENESKARVRPGAATK